jgi:hypothetical protein
VAETEKNRVPASAVTTSVSAAVATMPSSDIRARPDSPAPPAWVQRRPPRHAALAPRPVTAAVLAPPRAMPRAIRVAPLGAAGEPPLEATPGSRDPGSRAPGSRAPGSRAPGSRDPGSRDPGSRAPGSRDPGSRAPGSRDPGGPGDWVDSGADMTTSSPALRHPSRVVRPAGDGP